MGNQMTVSQRETDRLARGSLALAGYLLLTVGMTYPLVLQFSSAIPGDSFDGWQNYWNLWWVKTALVDKVTWPWFTDLLYHPTGVGLLFHTLNAFNGITFLPVQLAFGLLPAYNAVVVFSFATGGLGGYLLARQVLGAGSNRLAAFLAGAIFTFSPYHFAHLLGHMQLIALAWLPFYVLYTLRILRAAENPTPTTYRARSGPGCILPGPRRALRLVLRILLCSLHCSRGSLVLLSQQASNPKGNPAPRVGCSRSHGASRGGGAQPAADSDGA